MSFCTFATEAAQRGRRSTLQVWTVKSITSSAVSAGIRVAALSAGGGGSFALVHSSMTVCAGAFVTQMPAAIATASVTRNLSRRLFIFPPALVPCFERLHSRHVGIEHADRASHRRAGVVPDGAVARDLDFRHVSALRRRIESEFLGARVEADQRSAHAGVA